MRLVYEVIWNDGKFWATFEILKERKNASELKNGRQQIKIEGTLFDNCLVFWRDDWKMRSQQNETYQCFSLRCVSILYAPTRWLANCIVVLSAIYAAFSHSRIISAQSNDYKYTTIVIFDAIFFPFASQIACQNFPITHIRYVPSNIHIPTRISELSSAFDLCYELRLLPFSNHKLESWLSWP